MRLVNLGQVKSTDFRALLTHNSHVRMRPACYSLLHHVLDSINLLSQLLEHLLSSVVLPLLDDLLDFGVDLILKWLVVHKLIIIRHVILLEELVEGDGLQGLREVVLEQRLHIVLLYHAILIDVYLLHLSPDLLPRVGVVQSQSN